MGFSSLFQNGYFYFFTIGLQAICVLHCIRKGNQGNWIWLIVFLPLIGCVVYFFTEILNKNELQKAQTGVAYIFNTTGKIKRLEKNLDFSDTFQNRLLLADAYFEEGNIEKATLMYEKCLTGTFTENEYLISKLILAYFEQKRFEDIVRITPKILAQPQFKRSRAHLKYAISLANTGAVTAAEKEFKTMLGRYSYFENRYHYGLFLVKQDRNDEAKQVFSAIVEDHSHLTGYEKRNSKQWFKLSEEALSKLGA